MEAERRLAMLGKVSLHVMKIIVGCLAIPSVTGSCGVTSSRTSQGMHGVADKQEDEDGEHKEQK